MTKFRLYGAADPMSGNAERAYMGEVEADSALAARQQGAKTMMDSPGYATFEPEERLRILTSWVEAEPVPFTPLAHAQHRPEMSCGCYTGQPGQQRTHCTCGAAYDMLEVVTFTRWRCYDCGTIWHPRSPRT